MSSKTLTYLSSLIYHIPGPFSKKIVMIGNILFHDWRINPHIGYGSEGEKAFNQYKTLDDLPDISFLDKRSQDNIRRFMFFILMGNVIDKRRYFYNYSGLSEKLSWKQRMWLWLKKKKFCWRYHLSLLPGMTLEKSSCCFSHGLSLLPDSVTRYVENKLFIDAGAFIGDSALSFLAYNPKRILSFEPSPQMFNMLQNNISRITELQEKCEIYQVALGENSGDLPFCDNLFSCCHEDIHCQSTVKQTTVDDFVAGYDACVGLIKADIEGMGLKMIRGARKTILRDHPVLTIAVYHCPDEMFGIMEILKSWGLKYTYHYEFLDPELSLELTLIAYPEELSLSRNGLQFQKFDGGK